MQTDKQVAFSLYIARSFISAKIMHLKCKVKFFRGVVIFTRSLVLGRLFFFGALYRALIFFLTVMSRYGRRFNCGRHFFSGKGLVGVTQSLKYAT